MLVMVINLAIGSVTAASKTINIKNGEWESFWGAASNSEMDKYVIKKSGNFEVKIDMEYQKYNKKWATKNMPKKYFKKLVLSAESKKKFKSATFYLYDDKTGKYQKKLTFKPQSTYLDPATKGYFVYKKYDMNHRYNCKKVVINY